MAQSAVRVANRGGLTLLLLMLGVLANHHDATLALDDLALFTNFPTAPRTSRSGTSRSQRLPLR